MANYHYVHNLWQSVRGHSKHFDAFDISWKWKHFWANCLQGINSSYNSIKFCISQKNILIFIFAMYQHYPLALSTVKRISKSLLAFCKNEQHTFLLLYWLHMKSFIATRVISILVNLRYLRFKLLKYKENNKKICNTFDRNFKNIPLYIMSNVSLERYYFVLYDGALTLKMSKMVLNAFCDKTLHILLHISTKVIYH